MAKETSGPVLRCTSCGNTELFDQFMDYEIHLVDGHQNYIRLLAAEVDYYRCHQCGTRIEVPDQ